MSPAARQCPRRAYIGLGSNLNRPHRQLDQALQALAELPRTTGVRCSPRYRTAPVGDPDQPEFINAVVSVETGLGALELLRAMQAIEDRQGRDRDPDRRFGPRSLDLDLLLLGAICHRDAKLELPHPRMHERAFVLQPLADLDPTLEIPGHGRVDELLARLDLRGVRIEPQPR